MDAVLFIGLQASGKSSFFNERFFHSHIRLNLDMLRTRHRERLLFHACLKAKQPFVIDNTNPGRKDRARYIPAIREAGFDMTGYYFSSRLSDCLARNAQRVYAEQVPELGMRGCAARMEFPHIDEGFSRLFFVSLEAGQFKVDPWKADC
ncbi:MAG: AAA family ATPase [Planctomycetota bacterium]|nr:AAA family ATPase [Planctomycetota bacterium]